MSNRLRGSRLPVWLAFAAAAAACGTVQSDFTDAADDDSVDGQVAQNDAPPSIDGQLPDASPDGMVSIDAAIDAAIDASVDAPPVTYQLDVRIDGSGTGTVMAVGGSINCPGTCSATYGSGASVTLNASPTGTSTFAGWAGACTGMAACTVSMTQARVVTATFNAPIAPNLMFVTSTTHPGNLGGLAGADAICQARATAAGHSGTFRAWLSTPTASASSRMGTASGWVRTDGRPFANTLADLGAGRIFYPPILDENGASAGQQIVMTNTTIGGAQQPTSTDHCQSWTSSASADTAAGGYANASSYMFTNYVYQNCQTGGRLYCFGVDRAATVTPPPVAGARKAFQRLWTPGGGLAAADAACQSDATAAGLPGTYRALLAAANASALSRFSLTGGTWVRVDNAVILPTAQAWSTATSFDTGPNLSANGQTVFGNYLNWGGASSLTAAGTAASSCNSWTDTTMMAMRGLSGTTPLSTFFTSSTYQCNFASATITCLQQ